MAEEIAFENGWISNFEGLATLTLDRVIPYCIPSCITRRPLTTRQISLKSKKLFVDGRTYVQMDGRTDGRTFETGFIRSTLSKSRRNKRTKGSWQRAYLRRRFERWSRADTWRAVVWWEPQPLEHTTPASAALWCDASQPRTRVHTMTQKYPALLQLHSGSKHTGDKRALSVSTSAGVEAELLWSLH